MVLIFSALGGEGEVESLNSSIYGLVSDPFPEDGEEGGFMSMMLRSLGKEKDEYRWLTRKDILAEW
jgi:hypothetical protein